MKNKTLSLKNNTATFKSSKPAGFSIFLLVNIDRCEVPLITTPAGARFDFVSYVTN